MSKIGNFLLKYGMWILLICLVMLAWRYYTVSRTVQQAVDNNKALKDTLHFAYDKNKQQTATILSLQVQSNAQLQKLQSDDATIKLLQHYADSLTKKGYKVSVATVVSNATTDNGTTKTDIILANKTTPVDTGKTKISYVDVYPTYHTTWNEPWSVGEIFANKDSITRSIKIINQYETSTSYFRPNIFQPYSAIVQIKNLNPNTLTTEMRSVIVSPKTTRWGLGANFGGLYDPFQRKWTVGVQIGINYNLFSF